jgi:hypothetical protein
MSASAAAIGAEGAASLAADSASLSATYARHFIASDGPSIETCNALLRIKDSSGFTTVSTFDRSGNIYTTNSFKAFSIESYLQYMVKLYRRYNKFNCGMT